MPPVLGLCDRVKMPHPESPETPPAVLNEKTAFSWPVAVVLAAVLLGAGGGIARLERIQADHDLLRARVDLLEHQQGADRGQLQAQGATLAQVKEILVDLRADVREALRSGGVRPATHRE